MTDGRPAPAPAPEPLSAEAAIASSSAAGRAGQKRPASGPAPGDTRPRRVRVINEEPILISG